MFTNNIAALAGNMATDPELRYTTTGMPVCDFVLAVNRRRSASGAADFVRVTVFGTDAESVANYKRKGHGVKVAGRLDYQNWKSPEGNKRSVVKLIARKGGVTFLPKGSAISVNHVELMGNLTHDPELVKVGSEAGIEKASFGLAVDGIEKDDPDYFEVVAWRGLAKVVAEYKQKGDPVHLTGRLTYSQWEKEGSGARRSKIEITAEDVQFLPSGDPASRAGSRANARNAAAGEEVEGEVVEGEVVEEEDFDPVPF